MSLAPGWYPDPFSGGGYVRWWDGQRWGSSALEGSEPTVAPPRSRPTDPWSAGAPYELATWTQRALARMLDWLVVTAITLPFALVLAWPAVRDFVAAVPADGQVPASAFSALQDDLLSQSVAISLITAAVWYLYEVPQNVRWGRTLGKRAVGIRVRLRDADANPGWLAASLRWGLFTAGNLVAGFLFVLVDYLWPFWDKPYRQALHDKAARTVVVPSTPR
jgi:uncharacterized RDD family membrane protein YckC